MSGQAVISSNPGRNRGSISIYSNHLYEIHTAAEIKHNPSVSVPAGTTEPKVNNKKVALPSQGSVTEVKTTFKSIVLKQNKKIKNLSRQNDVLLSELPDYLRITYATNSRISPQTYQKQIQSEGGPKYGKHQDS